MTSSVTRPGVFTSGLSWAGIVAGPLGWGASFQAAYAAVPYACAHGVPITPVLSAIGVALALAGALLSFMAFRSPDHGGKPPWTAHSRQFLAIMGMAIGLLFALVMTMQGSAAFFFDGCER